MVEVGQFITVEVSTASDVVNLGEVVAAVHALDASLKSETRRGLSDTKTGLSETRTGLSGSALMALSPKLKLYENGTENFDPNVVFETLESYKYMTRLI